MVQTILNYAPATLSHNFFLLLFHLPIFYLHANIIENYILYKLYCSIYRSTFRTYILVLIFLLKHQRDTSIPQRYLFTTSSHSHYKLPSITLTTISTSSSPKYGCIGSDNTVSHSRIVFGKSASS